MPVALESNRHSFYPIRFDFSTATVILPLLFLSFQLGQGDIFIYTSADEEKGVLLELKGRGCRQFESYLLAQQRSWYDFLMDALIDGGVMKRIDLAINDHTGILDIPELAEKCRKREYIGKSRSYKFYQSGELIKHREDDREYMGRTLYLGSLKSDEIGRAHV